MAVGYTVGWGREVRQGRMWLDVVGYGRSAHAGGHINATR